MSDHKLTHRFVESVPDQLEQGMLYVSVEFGTVMHLCCCGCGQEVVNPLSPFDWKLTFDGESITLYPSIGNWSFSCRSHYWVRKNRVEWAGAWSDEEISNARKHDRSLKDDLINCDDGVSEMPSNDEESESKPNTSFLGTLWRRLGIFQK